VRAQLTETPCSGPRLGQDLCRSVRSPTLRKLLPQWSRGGQTGIRSFFGQSKAPKRKAEECAVSEDGAAVVAAAPRLGTGGRDGNGLSVAQRQRMEENRRVALRRRQARFSREAAAMQV
jgi:hypothetical protein